MVRPLQKHGVDYNVLTIVNAVNGDRLLEVYHFLRDEVKTDRIQFIPVVERLNEGSVALYQQGIEVSKRALVC